MPPLFLLGDNELSALIVAACVNGWQLGIVAMSLDLSAKLLYVGPG